MRYCQECGAIVASEDTFCPYCGISLEPFVVAVPPLPSQTDNEPVISAKGDSFELPETGDLDFASDDVNAAPIPPRASEIAQPAIHHAPVLAQQAENSDSLSTPVIRSENFSEAPGSIPTTDAADSQPPLTFESRIDEKEPQNDFHQDGNVSSESFSSESFSSDFSATEHNAPPAAFQPAPQPTEPPSRPIIASNAADKEARTPPISTESPLSFSPQSPAPFAQNANPALAAKQYEELSAEDDEPHTVVRGATGERILAEPFVSRSPEPREQNFADESQPPGDSSFEPEDLSDMPTQIGREIELAPVVPLRETPISAEAALESGAGNRMPEQLASTPEPVLAENARFGADAAAPSNSGAAPSQPQPETTGSKSPKLKPLDEGAVLNRRYEIVRKIGGGGMGAVYLAKDQNLGGVQRAVKEMIQAYVDETQQEKAVQDFRRESVLLTSLEHPAIPTIYDYFFDEPNGRFYLVMKYIAGGDLAGRLRASQTGRLDERSVTTWAMQIADVLDYLHNLEPPIVYRDLKPSNIMVDGNSGRAMLVDFGIARWVNKEEKGVTAVGTMGYAPPELFAGNAESRSDLYSLGATMFHLLTGADPQNNPLLIFDFSKNPRPRAIAPELSSEMEAIVTRAVEYNLQMRFGSAAEMRDTLAAHLEKIKAGSLTFDQPEVADRQSFSQPVPSQFPPPQSAPQPQVMVPSLVFCGFCGERIVPTDAFCAYCGSKQPEADRAAAQPASATAAPPTPPVSASVSGARATAKLVLETAALDSQQFLLEKETNLVGREDRRSNIFPEIDLSRFDALNKVSRRHARIWRQGATFMIEDLGSANGTTLVSSGNEAVRLRAHQPHALAHGDKLRVGETTLRFFVN